MKTILQEDENQESAIVVYLDGDKKKICTQIHLKSRRMFIPTVNADKYHHTYVPPELLHKPEEFPGVCFIVNIKALPDGIYVIPVEHDHEFRVF